MKPAAWAAITLTVVLTSCVRISDGMPVAGGAGDKAGPGTSVRPTRAIPTPEGDLTEPGVVPTIRKPIPADATTCETTNPAPVGVTASVADPAAPKITVALPSGWSTTKGDGDVGAQLQGPDGVTATVTIAATRLEPAQAFEQYANDAMATSAVSSVSVLPADLCGYSGQKLLGSWSDSPQQAVEFGDRIAHIWTNTNNYLVAVHVEGPADTAGFDPMVSPLMEDFSVRVP
jgi:hypothetical protein